MPQRIMTIDDQTISVDIQLDAFTQTFTLNLGDQTFTVVPWLRLQHGMMFLHQHKVYTLHCMHQSGQTIQMDINGSVFEMTLTNPKDLSLNTQSTQQNHQKFLHADMPGRVVKILVNEADQLQKGDALLVLEAMKMENELRAQTDVTIARICVQEGDSIESGQVLLEFSCTDIK